MWNDLTDQQKIDDAATGLKKLGNVKRKTYNKKATTDLFSEDNHFLRTQIKKLRKKALKKQLENQLMVELSVEYFQSQMNKRKELLRECILRSNNDSFNYHQPLWKKAIQGDNANGEVGELLC